mmetsp:Transcript_9059/g.11136  ORF Transcript_9059/g.11136 Transcript_9059/m.11136 type:complete len:445 (-) Transcript_9059:48-1382(-)|eukprot:CAMPEP_0172504912 /NCGR_PEP_ID=MMETSP1066-20121228/182167_1 /TAXON_ID=671091 /ORGANISM="Coscinodiscus wailesii, Strain CCMP2513" /LENGTH=444 /DNA_ID=CAMNT_0013281307 /DNA_START=69 /DNA_END=1403 /DNA_ORIENTATION=-
MSSIENTKNDPVNYPATNTTPATTNITDKKQPSPSPALQEQREEENLNIPSENVITRIEDLISTVINSLDSKAPPTISPQNITDTKVSIALYHNIPKRNFLNISQSRGVTSLLIVLSFVHSLLLSNRTTTTREVFYFFVTHFRSQRECDVAILDAARLLGVSRICLGLSASPKGWYCGCVKITQTTSSTNGTAIPSSFLSSPLRCNRTTRATTTILDGTNPPSSSQGIPITREWLLAGTSSSSPTLHISSDAKCILVIEKEGIYTRLLEDKFYDSFPCVLVTGRGFPDLATRALVYTLHKRLCIPVFGVCDCNPFGVGVLATYRQGGERMGVDRERYNVPIQWVGLRPSQLDGLGSAMDLPDSVYQTLTMRDRKMIKSLLLDEEGGSYSGKNVFMQEGNGRVDEVLAMERNGFKVELEALHWLGMDFLTEWMERQLRGAYGGGI